jgi:glutamate-ammonia-ligase adenylyltransferase
LAALTDAAAQIAFRQQGRAIGNLAALAAGIPEGVQNRIRILLAGCADPDGALHYLTRLQEDRPGAFHRITRHPANLQLLLTVFSYSRFLSEELLQNPEWIEQLVASGDLYRQLGVEELVTRLEADLAAHGAGSPPALALALFRRKQILRILLRDVLDHATLPEIAEELTNLADAIVDTACRRIRAGLAARYGPPSRLDAGGKARECGFSVVALGKMGGRELNYSSDVDLLFVYSDNGQTAGAESITNKEFFRKLANQLTALLSTYTPEGLCYRVDLRLRPEGSIGEVCVSLEGARAYYQTRARDWELQMLIKARVCGGEREPGRELLDFVEPLIYSSTLDFSAVEAVAESRERIGEKLARQRGAASGFDVKLARGGIRDIEFLVQCLQRLHGGREPWVRHGGTMLALARLRDKALLSDAEYSRLTGAYQFLRDLEHRLQVDEDRQTHLLPSDPEQLDLLARRMPATVIGAEPSAEALLARYNRHLEEVQEIYQRVIHAQRPIYYTARTAPARDEPAPGAGEASFREPEASNLVRFLDQRAPGLAESLARGRLRRGVRAFEHFLERVTADAGRLERLNGDPTLVAHAIDLFEHSAHFADELIRKPELIEELALLPVERVAAYSGDETVGGLRRFYARAMLRIQAESVCLQRPIFETLLLTSELADVVIAAAYRMAVAQVAGARPTPGYEPRDQLMVIALGRLGVKEFDIASDADLVFVLADGDAAGQMFWTRVAERVIDILTSYTGEGVMFAVDTRLRPNGRDAPLVQAESAYKDYFARGAEAWEGISYMKSRAVAGDLRRATAFLEQLQDIDWRRYGQSGRSRRELFAMRMRLEKEQGPKNPLKAARGGYFDIDFSLMYLRLKSAGIFFPVLNTPARIDVIEKMGHLDRAEANFLRDAATFYRAVDHALRVSTGQAEGTLPSSASQLELLRELVRRWTPHHLHDQPLDVELAQIRHRTRDFFERLFGPE